MAGVRRRPQRVQHPDIKAGNRRQRFIRNAAQVAGIGKPADAEAQCGNLAMCLPGSITQIAPPGPSIATSWPAAMMLAQDRRIAAVGGR
jgi:hypothetical protein